MLSVEPKKTLLLLTPGFPKDENDTTCLPFLQSHVNALNKEYPEVEIIVLAFQYPYSTQTYSFKSNQVIPFDGRERPKFHRLWIWCKVWINLMKLKKSKKIIGILSIWCTECAFVGHYFAKLNNIRHQIWMYGQDAKAGNKYIRWIRPKADELAVISDFLSAELFKNYKLRPTHVIPLGVDRSDLTETPSSRDIDILGAGSLIKLKQYDKFISVMSLVKSQKSTCKSLICGKGPEEEYLKSLLYEYELTQHVTLMGEIAHHRVIELMQRLKVFVHTSNYEGLGVVCLEALMAGAHVVSYTKPFEQAIPNWHHVQNEEEMAAKILELLNNENLNHEQVVPFTTKEMAHKIMNLFA